MSSKSYKGIVKFRECQDSPIAVIAFPGVGNSAYFYSNWTRFIPKHLNFYAVEYPGHGQRGTEASLTDFSELKSDLIKTLAPHLKQDTVFIGHSMGGLLAYEIASWLQQAGIASIKHIFILSCPTPEEFMRTNEVRFESLEDEDILMCLHSMGGVPQEILENASFLSHALPKIRSDFRVVKSYSWKPASLLGCSLSIAWGNADQFCMSEQVMNWKSLSLAATEFRMFSGDHFFMQKDHSNFFEFLNSALLELSFSQEESVLLTNID